jgi:hypothetical protein
MTTVGTPWVIVGIMLIGFGFPILRWVGRIANRYTLLRQAAAITAQQMGPLLRRRAQLVTLDPYGKPRFERWDKEIDYFIAQHIEPSLTVAECASLRRNHERVATLLARTVEAAFAAQPASQVVPDDMTPGEYEVFCADQLRQAGWSAHVTMLSRDQGVDVIAEKDRKRIILQCKLHARPVGNKAVQEAAAARAHEAADFAIVVSNNRFTPAAEQLASTNGVLLLHHRDLVTIDSLLSERA